MRTLPFLACGLGAALALAGCTPGRPAKTVTVFTPPAQSAGSARPGATASAAATTSSPNATPTSPSDVPALTQTFCTPNYKLCFKLPAGYSVSMHSNDGSAYNVLGTVNDAGGKPIMTVGEGISGLGGMACTDSGKSTNTVVATAPTKAQGLSTQFPGNDAAATVTQVVQPGARSGGYTAEAFLTNRDAYTRVGPLRDCGLNYADLITRTSQEGAFHLGMANWYNSDSYVPEPEYATPEEAKAQFDTPRYKVAFEIMKSAYFG